MKMTFEFKYTTSGVEIVNSYKAFWDKDTIDNIWNLFQWKRTKFSIYLEWFIHTLCYKLHIKRSRAKDCFLEFDKSWFKALFV